MTHIEICTLNKNKKFTCPQGTDSLLAVLALRNTIRWTLLDDSDDIPGRKREIKALKRAFLRWGLVIPVRFRYVKTKEEAEIVITVARNDPYFVKNKFAIAYAYLGDAELDIVFNGDWPNWRMDDKPVGANDFWFEAVAVHEIGHRLTLPHSVGCPTCVMNPTYNKKVKLQEDDIKRVQAVWGKRNGFMQRILWMIGYLKREI